MEIARQCAHLDGRRIAVALPAGPEFLTTCLAAMSRGVCLPLDAGLRAAEFESAIATLRPDLVIRDPVASASGLARPATDPEPSSVALVIRTSGTTGAGKSVPLTHANLCASAGHIREAMQMSEVDRLLSPAPLHHIAGLALALASLSAGACTFIAPGLPAALLFDIFEDFRPTLLWATPSLLAELVMTGRRIGFNREHVPLRAIRCGAAALRPELLREAEDLFGAPVIETYGMTEAAPQITCSPLPPAPRKIGSAGKPAGPEVRIRSATGGPAAAGESGEIEIRGPNVCSGYEDADAECFLDGWLRTGDLGYLDADGFLFVTGRLKEQINRGGESISPLEVERVLLRHPDVRDAAVFGMPDERLGEAVAAAVVFVPGRAREVSELREFAAQSLSDAKVPSSIVAVDEIPRTVTGKLQRASLAAHLGLGSSVNSRPEFIEPRDDLERDLAAIWREILKLDRIGVEDDFYALGGGSLAVIRMLGVVQERYGAGNQLRERIEFFARPTIAHQAEILRGALQESEPATVAGVERLSDGRELDPLFCIPGAAADVSYFAAMARHTAAGRSVYGLWNQSLSGCPTSAPLENLASELITRMRSIQPDGPYLLGGHCYGGIVAYEMAQQLAAAGEQVSALLLFDTPRPLYPDPRWHQHLYAARVVDAIHETTRLPRRQRIRVAAESVRTLLTHLKRLTVSQVDRVRIERKKWASNGSDLRAARAYDPKPYHGRVVHFMAACDGNPSVLDPRFGWRELAQGLEEITVPGDHTTMFHDPNVRELAGQVDAALTTMMAF
jgi:acyl-CoA synthetase (AMP-forming)/AMP-acid ligase II/thioesterase domain-containing protein